MNQSGTSRVVRRSLVLVAVVSSFARADSWTLTTADFQTQHVELRSLSAESLSIATPAGPQTVPVSNVLGISREISGGAQKRQEPGAFVLVLGSGDRFVGAPQALSGETLTWKSPAVGEMKVSLRDVRSLAKAAQTAPLPDQPPAEDTLTLSNGDVVKGIVSGLEAGKIAVTQGVDAVPVPLESVATLVFASPAKPPEGSPARAFRVTLSDGSTLTAPAVEIAGETATLRLADKTARPVPLTSVAAVEQVNGPVTFLSSLTPTEDVQRPYLGDPWPTRFDRTVTGEALRTPKGPVAHGIGVHAYSRLTFNLPDPSYKTFRTQFAIDGGGPYANVSARVLLDGKPAFERANVTSTVPSDVVSLPLNGAKTLTLEVDYGQSNDTQDRFMWLDPALVRADGGPTSTTGPTGKQ